MSEKYFDKFPLISYNGQVVVNITERTSIRDNVLKNPYVFYPYDLQNNERPDQISDVQYNDEYLSWLVYLSNGITDPYYDWHMDDDTFFQYLTQKYGSIELIQQQVAFYRNNWYNDTAPITASQYNSLPDISRVDVNGKIFIDTAKKYFVQDQIVNNVPITYARKRIDDRLVTNRIIRYDVTTGNSAFTENEIVRVNLAYANSGTHHLSAGQGQVVVSNSSSVTIQSTSGYVREYPGGYTPTSGSFIYGTQSGSNCSVSSTITSLANNISLAETIYWEPVTVYDYEVEKNTINKTIRMLDPSFTQVVSDQLANLLTGK
jgi:hypothetical protein